MNSWWATGSISTKSTATYRTSACSAQRLYGRDLNGDVCQRMLASEKATSTLASDRNADLAYHTKKMSLFTSTGLCPRSAASDLPRRRCRCEHLTNQPAPRMLLATYTVVAGDTLGAIAARLGVSLDALIAANGLTDPNRLAVGKVPDYSWRDGRFCPLQPARSPFETDVARAAPGDAVATTCLPGLAQDASLIAALNGVDATARCSRPAGQGAGRTGFSADAGPKEGQAAPVFRTTYLYRITAKRPPEDIRRHDVTVNSDPSRYRNQFGKYKVVRTSACIAVRQGRRSVRLWSACLRRASRMLHQKSHLCRGREHLPRQRTILCRQLPGETPCGWVTSLYGTIGRSSWTADLLMATWHQAETGRPPERRAWSIGWRVWRRVRSY